MTGYLELSPCFTICKIFLNKIILKQTLNVSNASMEEKYTYEKIQEMADNIMSRTSQRPKLGNI